MQRPRRAAAASLYAAGFTTAFGAHSIAANLGGYTSGQHESLLALGVLLALYDGAEVLLKPVFGTLADRVGPRPVLLGGLAAFAVFSAVFAAAGDPALVGVARFGQGAAASAFSPAAGALVARLNPKARQGRAFGGYGLYKSLGYAAGPLLGGVLVTTGGLRLLFAVLAVLGRRRRRVGGAWRCPRRRRSPGPGRPCWTWPGGCPAARSSPRSPAWPRPPPRWPPGSASCRSAAPPPGSARSPPALPSRCSPWSPRSPSRWPAAPATPGGSPTPPAWPQAWCWPPPGSDAPRCCPD